MLDDLTPFGTAMTAGDRYLLLWCHTGTVSVTCGEVVRLTAGRGVLVPPGKEATLLVAPGAVMVPVRIAPAEVPEGHDDLQVFTPGEEWNNWLLHHFTASIAPLREPGHRSAELVEALAGSRPEGCPALPRTAAALAVAHGLLRDPASPLTAAAWAARVRVGERTLHRVFPAETGLTFAAWRREARLAAARDLLRASGVPVSQVGEAVGFRTSTGFIRAFRNRFGRTPRVWRAERDGTGTPATGFPGPPVWGELSAPSSLDHGFHLLLWVRRGSMELTVGGRVLGVGEGQIAWMPAYRGHGVRAMSGSVVLPLTFTVGEADPGADFGPVDVPEYEVRALLQHVMANQCGVAPEGYERTTVLDAPWVPGTVRRDEAAVAVERSPAAQVADALLGDLRDRRTLPQWAASVGRTPRQLNAGFRADTGMTFLQWRTTVRLQTARRFLAAGATPSESAHAVGYRHLSQFSRDFSRHYGVTPREFVGT
ncbi:helix-turn-helix domain-containing protein [Corynebacterium nuruki]|uniref:helix-turn-helix domain-containing protein n=1 Tax=Corynebacterium nuruki TaxID=1032851 RepID=UPI0039BF3DA4